MEVPDFLPSVSGEVSSSVCCHSGYSGAAQTATECPSRSCAGEWTCSAKWGELMREATASVSNEHRVSPSRDSDQPRAEAACRKVQLGEVSRARQCLTGASLAPGTEATFREMQSRRPQEVQRPIPREVLEFQPATPLVADRKKFLTSLKSAPRGASPGRGGCTYEHLSILLDDRDTFELLFEAATSLAQASVLPDIASALMSARLTALTKLDGAGFERLPQDVR